MAQGVEYSLPIDPADSNVDFTLGSVLQNGGAGLITSNTDTETITLGGTITLDIDFAGSVVNSVDFVNLLADYQVTLANPNGFELTVAPGFQGEGTTIQLRLPFDPDVATGNPVPVEAPCLNLQEADKGNESGTAGNLNLSGSAFDFVGTAQFFNNPEVPNGFPYQLGPFPGGNLFPNAPTDPNNLVGTVSVLGNCLEFDGTFSVVGTGGAGLLKSTQIHQGTLVARAPFRPVDGEPLIEFSKTGTTITLVWHSAIDETYQILGSTDLKCFHYVIATGVASSGTTTSMNFSLPTELSPSRRAFFVVEKE